MWASRTGGTSPRGARTTTTTTTATTTTAATATIATIATTTTIATIATIATTARQTHTAPYARGGQRACPREREVRVREGPHLPSAVS